MTVLLVYTVLCAVPLLFAAAAEDRPQRAPEAEAVPRLSKASRKPMDVSGMPPALRPLVPGVQRWGAVASDSERYALADAAEADERLLAELEALAAAWTPEVSAAYEEWSRELELTESHEVAKFYFTLLLLDELDIPLPPAPRGDPVADAIAALKETKGVAADAERMWAARDLAERGPEAAAAVEALRVATRDAKPQVRAWAHAALALIEGDVEGHRKAIRRILADDGDDALDRSFAESALEELDRTPEERALARLCGAAITNDVEVARKLIDAVDVNKADHHGQTPLGYAVGNNHPAVAKLLLEAGAKPNQRDRFGDDTVLHDAAGRRRGAAMIELLLKHGADPLLRDRDGNTPLDVARESGRKANAALLERAAAAAAAAARRAGRAEPQDQGD